MARSLIVINREDLKRVACEVSSNALTLSNDMMQSGYLFAVDDFVAHLLKYVLVSNHDTEKYPPIFHTSKE